MATKSKQTKKTTVKSRTVKPKARVATAPKRAAKVQIPRRTKPAPVQNAERLQAHVTKADAPRTSNGGGKKSKRVRITLRNVILSYPYVFRKSQYSEDGDSQAKFSCAIVCTEKTTGLDELKRAALAVGIERFGDTYKTSRKSGRMHWPFRADADDIAEKGYPKGSEFFNASSGQKPGVVSRYADPKTGLPTPITDESEIYPGVIANVTLTPFSFDKKGKKKGVGIGLGNIQKFEDGTRLDSFVAAQDEFTADQEAADLEELDEDDDYEDEEEDEDYDYEEEEDDWDDEDE